MMSGVGLGLSQRSEAPGKKPLLEGVTILPFVSAADLAVSCFSFSSSILTTLFYCLYYLFSQGELVAATSARERFVARRNGIQLGFFLAEAWDVVYILCTGSMNKRFSLTTNNVTCVRSTDGPDRKIGLAQAHHVLRTVQCTEYR